jgi:hypothetical protein
MVTAQDVRRLAPSLPRTEERLVWDRIKFLVGRIVYLAISRDETSMRSGGSHRARMTTEEANAVNIVLGYMAGQEEPPAMVVRALEQVARRAHNRLQSGWDEQAVRQQWPRAFDEVEAAP